jgi:uncharacterized protein involved in outer membrane biogenesis
VKKLLLALLVLVSLAVATVLVLPGFIDWNAWRGEIARRISALTGRAVAIDGEIDFALLPTPILSAEGVRVASAEGAVHPDMLAAEALEARVALFPLLAGRVEIERIILSNATVVVETLPDGRSNWSLDTAGARLPQDVRLDRLTVENGTLIWRDAGGHEERLEETFLQVSAESLAGPAQAIGSLTVRGVGLAIDVTTGRLSAGGALPVTATAGVDGANAELRFNGILAEGGRRLQGNVRLSGSSVADAVRPFLAEGAADWALAAPFRVEAAVLASEESIELNGLSVTAGDTAATGAVSLVLGEVPRADVTLTANRLDLDAWLGDGEDPVDLMLAWRGGADGRLDLPGGLAAGIDVEVSALDFRGQLLRQVRLAGGYGEGMVTIDRAEALLPAGSSLLASGTVMAPEGKPQLDLALRLTSGNLRSLLEWLGYDLSAVPGTRLRRFDGQATVRGMADAFQVTGAEITLDSTTATGGLAFLNRGRPGIGLRLDADRLNLDAYLPGGGEMPGWEVLAGWLGGVDANVDADIGMLGLAGLSATGVRLDATLDDGGLAVRQAAVADLAGSALSVSGNVGALAPLAGLDLSVALRSADVAALADTLALTLPAPAMRAGAVSLDGRLGGDAAALSVSLAGEVAGGTVEIAGTVKTPSTAPALDLAVRARHPDALAAIRIFAPGYRPASLSGALDLYARLAGDERQLDLDDIQGTIGPVSLAGGIAWDGAGDRPRIDADLRTSDIVLDGWLGAEARGVTAMALPLPPGEEDGGGILAGIDGSLALTASAIALGAWRIEAPALQARLDDGRLEVEQLAGGLFGGRLGIAGSYGGGRVAVDADLVGADLAAVLDGVFGLSGMTGRLDVGGEIAAEGTTLAGMVGRLSGSGLIAVRDGALDGVDLAAVADGAAADDPLRFLDTLRTALSSGRTPFAALNATFTIADGMARSEDLRLVSDRIVGEGGGTLALARRQLDVALDIDFNRPAGLPALGLRLQGPAESPQARFQTQAIQAHVARRAAEALTDGRPVPPEEGPPAPPPADAPTQ